MLKDIAMNTLTGQQVDLWIYETYMEPISTWTTFSDSYIYNNPPTLDCVHGSTTNPCDIAPYISNFNWNNKRHSDDHMYQIGLATPKNANEGSAH